MDRQMDNLVDGWMNGHRQLGGWMDEWTEKCIDSLNG